MLTLFEMGVRETEEDFAELAFGEEVGEEFHRVGADAGDVLVGGGGGVLDAQGADFFLDVFCDCCADFHACLIASVMFERDEKLGE